MNIRVELWLWLGVELGGDFRPLSDMRSELEVSIEKDTTIGKLFDQLANRYPTIRVKIFNKEKQKFYENVVAVFNDRAISPSQIYETKLKEGDKITILPVYYGG